MTDTDYSQYEGLGLSLDDGIMTVTLSNPKRRNAVTVQQSQELMHIWDDLWADNNVRVIILTGEGDDFCSGADLADLNKGPKAEGTTPDTPEEQPVRPNNRVTRIAKKHLFGILDCEKPVLAKVRGVAYGMGANMALACDMVFAAPNARFCDSHVKSGMVAGDGGVLLWPLLVGPHRAKQYLMTGEPINANKAEKLGLINEVVDNDELDAYVQQMAERLRDLPPHAVTYTKMAINAAIKNMTGNAFEMSLGYELYSMRTNDFKEATRAFVEKRPANYTGT